MPKKHRKTHDCRHPIKPVNAGLLTTSPKISCNFPDSYNVNRFRFFPFVQCSYVQFDRNAVLTHINRNIWGCKKKY